MDLRKAARSPLAWILLAVGFLHLVGIDWGLPASDGWDNDGVAPRDFLPGLAATLTPGSYYTYPPVHLALLAALTLPVTLTAVIRAPTPALHDVVAEILRVPYMTAMAYVARVVSLVMSVAIVLFVARIAEEIHATALDVAPRRPGGGMSPLGAYEGVSPVRRAGWCTAAIAGSHAALTYYAHTSNLDVPYLFWATWSLLVFTRAVAWDEPRLLRRAAVLAAFAIGTKDQAYALFVVAYPAAFALAALERRPSRTRLLAEGLLSALLALVVLLTVDGALLNPSGFRARIAFLTGSASQDYVEYTADWRGRVRLLVDAARSFHFQYPVVVGIAIAVGIVLAFLRSRRRATTLAVAALPLLAAISFTVAFNWTARRTDARFLMPQGVVLAVYGGLALEAVAFARGRAARIAGQSFASVALASALFTCISIDANLLFDSRYATERWLAEHVRPGDTIETYGLNVYLPRMPAAARVIRVGPEPVDRRNPIPGMEEVQAPFEQAPQRGARFIVLSDGWVWRYLTRHDAPATEGRQQPPTIQRSANDEAATRWFEDLVEGRSAYRRAHESRYDARIFPIVDVHGTVGRNVWVFER